MRIICIVYNINKRRRTVDSSLVYRNHAALEQYNKLVCFPVLSFVAQPTVLIDHLVWFLFLFLSLFFFCFFYLRSFIFLIENSHTVANVDGNYLSAYNASRSGVELSCFQHRITIAPAYSNRHHDECAIIREFVKRN